MPQPYLFLLRQTGQSYDDRLCPVAAAAASLCNRTIAWLCCSLLAWSCILVVRTEAAPSIHRYSGGSRGIQSRHSRIPDFLKETFLRIFPNRTFAQNTYVCLSLVCLAMLPSTKMKPAMGFVHTLINVEILVLSCA